MFRSMVMLSALVCAAPALAEESEFAGTEEVDTKFATPESELTAELGGAYASGNSVYYTVNGSGTGWHRWNRNKLQLITSANIGGSVPDADEDGILSDTERTVGMVENARRYAAEVRYDRFIGLRDSLYVLASGFVDPFAGYDMRTHEQLGYSRQLVDSEQTTAVAEVGFDVAQEFYVAGVDPDYANVLAARVMFGITHAFNDNVAFGETIEVYENVLNPLDLRLLNTAYLSSSLGGGFSIKLSHALIFDNVPVEGYRSLDQVTSVALVAKVL
jgi:putative salt-induced outer membrane protein YdiY